MIKHLLVLLVVGFSAHRADLKKDCAGVWVDDGKGHTVKAELPPREAKVLKMDMLDLLGIQEPPRRRHHHHKSSGSAPRFLKTIYDALDERGNAPHLGDQYREAVSAADTIITFVNKGHPRTPRHKSAINLSHSKHDKGKECTDGSNKRLHFDVSDVPLDLILLGSELRIYRNSLNLVQPEESLLINIYQEAKVKSSEQLIAELPLPQNGWVSINVTTAVLSWIIFPSTNMGLRISVTKPGKKHELHLHSVGVAGAHDKDDIRPFLVGFFAKPIDGGRPPIQSRHIRSADLKSGYSNPYLTAAATTPLQADSPVPHNQCQKRPLHVSFRDLGWEDWVIAPEGYDANFCEGRCQFPMLANMNATNHAIIQTLVKMKHAIIDSQELPPDASCAPQDLSTISVLYYDYSYNVVLKKYPKMIVKTCACL